MVGDPDIRTALARTNGRAMVVRAATFLRRGAERSIRWRSHLGRRYLEGFGPASLRDLSQFALIYRPLAREALETQADSLVRIEGPGGTELFDVPGATLPDEDAPAPPRLLGMWDSALLAYADRSRIVPPDYRRLVSRSNGDLLPTVLVDGYVAGVWRPVDEGIEVTAFEKLPTNAWRGIETEAAYARGVRGVPTLDTGDELVWGDDRIS